MNTLVFDTLQRRWRMSVTRPVPWPAVAAVVLMLVLLSAFYQVVNDSVRTSQTRRMVGALKASAAVRCNAPRNAGPRDDCAQQPQARLNDVASR